MGGGTPHGGILCGGAGGDDAGGDGCCCDVKASAEVDCGRREPASGTAPATANDTDTAPRAAGWRGGAAESAVLATLDAALKVASRMPRKAGAAATDPATAAGPAPDPERSWA